MPASLPRRTALGHWIGMSDSRSAPRSRSARSSSPGGPPPGWAAPTRPRSSWTAGPCWPGRSTRSSTPARSWCSATGSAPSARSRSPARTRPRVVRPPGLLAGLDAFARPPAVAGGAGRGHAAGVHRHRWPGCAAPPRATTGRSCCGPDGRRQLALVLDAAAAARRTTAVRRGARAAAAQAAGPARPGRGAGRGDEARDVDGWADLRDLRTDLTRRRGRRARHPRDLPERPTSYECGTCESPRLDRRAVRRARHRDGGRRGPGAGPRPGRRPQRRAPGRADLDVPARATPPAPRAPTRSRSSSWPPRPPSWPLAWDRPPTPWTPTWTPSRSRSPTTTSSTTPATPTRPDPPAEPCVLARRTVRSCAPNRAFLRADGVGFLRPRVTCAG